MAADYEVVEDKPGKCPKCPMDLVPVRLKQKYTCPQHPSPLVEKDSPGICPIDRQRTLVPVTVAEYWTCPDESNSHHADPGKCANGKDRQRMSPERAHSDHSPRHGGPYMAMADDKWHHVEATVPQPGLVRVHFYDNYLVPISVKAIAGRIAFVNPLTSRELESIPLRPSPDGMTLDAQIGSRPFPFEIAVKVRLVPNPQEQSFFFSFKALSREP